MAADWSLAEVEAVVSDYFSMLERELRNAPYSKTEHRNRLKPRLAGRSDGSIERKHQNISAILIESGFRTCFADTRRRPRIRSARTRRSM